jgi:hypothetical protein
MATLNCLILRGQLRRAKLMFKQKVSEKSIGTVVKRSVQEHGLIFLFVVFQFV